MKKNLFLITGFLAILFSAASYAADVRDAVHDETNGTVVRSTSGNCVRTQWSNGYDECAARVAAPVKVQQHKVVAAMSREDRTIYFGFNQASLSPAMTERLDTLASKISSDQNVKGARIVGYADRIGNPSYNETLSKKRAETVQNYLVAKGILNTSVTDTKWVGSSKSVTECSDKLPHAKLVECLKADRRVEVEIDSQVPATKP